VWVVLGSLIGPSKKKALDTNCKFYSRKTIINKEKERQYVCGGNKIILF